jgi:flagellar protein FlaF
MIAMLNASHAAQAYKAASRYRSQRDQEADVFRQATGALKGAKDAGPIQQIRALTDNRRLWTTVSDLLRDPGNALPEPLRAALLSVGLTVQREMDQEAPDFDFLISINENIAAGLAGQP